MIRRYPDIKVHEYSLDEFRMFYSGLLAIAGAHDHLNYLWSREHSFPVESAVLVKHRWEWVCTISGLTGLPRDLVYSMVRDTTFGRVRSDNFHVLPFAPMTGSKSVLALAPPFSLGSNWEENILPFVQRSNCLFKDFRNETG